MIEKHLSAQFDAELRDLCARVMLMGGMVELQFHKSLSALEKWDMVLADEVMVTESDVNNQEVLLDAECVNIIALRQPTAVDLRLLMSVSKTIANIERVGDESNKIAKKTKRLADVSAARDINFSEIKVSGQMASNLFKRALDAFARLDVQEASNVLREDALIDKEFRAFVRKLVMYMMEDPKAIAVGLDFLFIAKAIERVGDHAKNIAEYVIYTVQGTDVRHSGKEKGQYDINHEPEDS